jgi:signal transduction histidine kinase
MDGVPPARCNPGVRTRVKAVPGASGARALALALVPVIGFPAAVLLLREAHVVELLQQTYTVVFFGVLFWGSAVAFAVLPGLLLAGLLRSRLPESGLGAELDRVRGSSARIVAAADAERRRIERDLHDGAQQRLVTLALELRAAQGRLGPEGERLVASAVAQLRDAVDELRALARGVHPAILTENGLSAALESLAIRAPIPVVVDSAPPGRLAADVEAAAYFVASEGLANVVKHAGASRVTIGARQEDGRLVVEVADDGVGGAALAGGSGLRGLADRVEALGGGLSVESPRGGGTRLRAELPCGS